MKRILLATAALSLAASAAMADTVIATAMSGGHRIFVDGEGMTLYTFDKDAPGMSACTGGCAEKWPPLMAARGAKPQGDFGIIDRPDGGMYGGRQWTYDGMPLYTWVGDTEPGDVTGDGVGGVWHTAMPGG